MQLTGTVRSSVVSEKEVYCFSDIGVLPPLETGFFIYQIKLSKYQAPYCKDSAGGGGFTWVDPYF